MKEQKKILILDESQELRGEFLKVLRQQQYEVFVADDGKHAIRIAQDSPPDLMIADALSEKMESSQVIKTFREMPWGKKMRVIVLSARAKMKDYFDAIGVDDFMEKPIDPDILLAKVKELLCESQPAGKNQIYKRLLLVGRCEECIQEMQALLNTEGCHTDYVLFGEQVISKAVLFLPNLIIIESRMLDMSSSSIIRILRQMPQFKKIPILVYNHLNDHNTDDADIKQEELVMSVFVRDCLDEGATESIGRYEKQTFVERVNKYLKHGTIVVIDDDEGVVRFLKKVLENDGYQIFAARNAETGLNLIKQTGPDLIVLDIVLPGKNGYEVLQMLKDDARTKQIPVMMVTVQGQDVDIQKALDLGAEDYMVKPINASLFLKRVKTILSAVR